MTTVLAEGRRTRRPSAVLVVVGGALILVLSLTTLCIGSPTLAPLDAVRVLLEPDGSQTSIIVHTLRVPRVLLAIAAGAALAVAGVIMQALTRNPLADPGILGVNAGASFFVALAFVVFGVQSFGAILLFAFVGAAVVSVLVALLGGVGRSDSIGRLALAGVAVAAVLTGFTQAIALIDPRQYANIRVWEAGSLTARDVPTSAAVLVVILVALVIAFANGPGLNLLVLGADSAHSLGARVARVRGLSALAIVLLCGTATAAIGPIGFVGLLVPHALRPFTGADQMRALWLSALAGPVLLLGSDAISRLVIAPAELPLGVVTAFLGAPVLIALVQRGRVIR